jgi:hypothetical protein
MPHRVHWLALVDRMGCSSFLLSRAPWPLHLAEGLWGTAGWRSPLGWLEGAERQSVWQRYVGVVQWKDVLSSIQRAATGITGLGGPVAVFSTTGPQLSELPAAHPALSLLTPPEPRTPRGGPCTRRSQKQQIVGRCAQMTRLRRRGELDGRRRSASQQVGLVTLWWGPSWTGSPSSLTAPPADPIAIGRAVCGHQASPTP